MDSSIVVAIIAAVATIIAAIIGGYMQSRNKNSSDKSSEVLKDKIEASNSNSYPVKLPQKSIETNDKVLVTGKISKIDGSTIYLEDPTFKFT